LPGSAEGGEGIPCPEGSKKAGGSPLPHGGRGKRGDFTFEKPENDLPPLEGVNPPGKRVEGGRGL